MGADGARGTNEACVAELSDSSLLLNARDLSSIAGGGPTRLLQHSADGGASWSEPWRSPSLVQPGLGLGLGLALSLSLSLALALTPTP